MEKAKVKIQELPASLMWWKEKLVNDELMKDPPSVQLKDWGTIRDEHGKRLIGIVYGHPNFPDGSDVTTSLVQEINCQLGIARTLNTVYILVGPRQRFRGSYQP